VTSDSSPGGTGDHACDEEKGVSMTDVEARIERLLDEMERPGLSDEQLSRIKKQIEYLRTFES
jgi:hypothetical protein